MKTSYSKIVKDISQSEKVILLYFALFIMGGFCVSCEDDST